MIAETVLEDGVIPLNQSLMDLTMLTLVGGRERTLKEFEQLLDAADFRIDATPAIEGMVKMIVAKPR